MKHTFSPDRSKLLLHADEADRKELSELGDTSSDVAMVVFLLPLIYNSELHWIDPAITGDLTDAPMLGILGEEGDKDRTIFPENYGLVTSGYIGQNEMAQPILERWAFMDYQVRSVLQALRDTGIAIFIS